MSREIEVVKALLSAAGLSLDSADVEALAATYPEFQKSLTSLRRLALLHDTPGVPAAGAAAGDGTS